MLSIFDVDPPMTGTPTRALKIGSDNLLAAAEGAVRRRKLRAAGFEHRARFISKVILTTTRDEVNRARESVLGTISVEALQG
jgi:hypothetical protein